jgi:hypothetical protein
MSFNSPVSHSVFDFVNENDYRHMCSKFETIKIEDSDIPMNGNIPGLSTTEENMFDDESETETCESEHDEKIDMVYLVKLDENVVTYATTFEEVDDVVEYLIKKISYKYKLSGFEVYTDDKLRILDDSKIIKNIYGTKKDNIISYEQILFTISINIVPKYTKTNFYKMKL